MKQSDPNRLLPLLAAAFAELGYRGATTATLARRCGVRENVLYRIWPDKKAMFLAAIDHVWQSAFDTWEQLLASPSQKKNPDGPALRILCYESTHHGEFHLHKLVFAALTETDEPEIAAALQRMYARFHAFIAAHIATTRHPRPSRRQNQNSTDLTAWALIGLATIANITRDLRLLTDRQRALLYTQIAQSLLKLCM
jgi:AcrR family transcriptional regulator